MEKNLGVFFGEAQSTVKFSMGDSRDGRQGFFVIEFTLEKGEFGCNPWFYHPKNQLKEGKRVKIRNFA